jgi:hypothetical protein
MERGHGATASPALSFDGMNAITAIPGAAQIATGAIQRSVDGLRKDADMVARSTDVSSRETLGALIDSRQQVLYTAAAARLIDASDEMIRSLLDVRA